MKKACYSVPLFMFLLFASFYNAILAADYDYDAANDVVSERLARRIADARCLQYFGKKDLFDVVRYYDENDRISVYVFVYRSPSVQVSKPALLKEIEENGIVFLDFRKKLAEAKSNGDFHRTQRNREEARASLERISRSRDFVSIYVSASKTRMPVIEWKNGLPESYTMLGQIKKTGNVNPENMKFYYFGPTQLKVVLKDRPKEAYRVENDLLIADGIISSEGPNFRRKALGREAKEKIDKTWAIYSSQSIAPKDNTIDASHQLSPMPDFRQYEYDHLFGASSAGTCGIMAVADVIGYFDQFVHGNYWNLVDMTWFQGPDNYPDGGFYVLPGLNTVDQLMLDLAETLEYDPTPGTGGVPPLGLGNRIEEFTDTQNGLAFTVEDQASVAACTYETLKSRIDSGWPIILRLTAYAIGSGDGGLFGYPTQGAHFVTVKGYDTGYGYEEPICVHMNTGVYGDVWWDYYDLWNWDLGIWSYEIIPGGSPGTFVNPPTLESPGNGDVSANPQPVMNWSDASGAAEYRIQIASDSGFSSIVYDELRTSSSFTIPTPLADGTYFWRVVPRNSVGNWCHFSGGYSFIINTAPVSILTDTDTLSVPEGGAKTFRARLSSQPPSSVAVSVARTAGDSNINISGGASLSFSTSNWYTWQTVTLSATEDADAANGQATLQLTGSGVTSKNVTGIEEDNDAINFDLHGWEELNPNEGDYWSVMVSLTAQPAANISATMIKVSGDADLTTDIGRVLTFTPSNWNQNQYFYVYAAEDLDAYEGTATFRVSASGVASKDVVATENENDILDIEVEGGLSSISVPEGGTNSFRVRLTAQPIINQVVSVFRRYDTDDPDIIVQSGCSMFFTSANYQTYQTATIAALDDLDCANGVAEIRIRGVGEKTITESVDATEIDNDTMAIVASTDSIGVPEGGANSLSVRLSHQPTSNIILTVVRSSGDEDISVQSGSSLTFTSTDWAVNQQVTLAAAEDADTTDGTATIQISGAGVANKDITAIEEDNDGVILYPDLLIESLTLSPEDPTTGDNIIFTAVVKNQGSGPSAASVLYIRIGGESTGTSHEIPPLEAGASHPAVRGPMQLTPAGPFRATALADYLATVTESDETNNEFSIDFNVRVKITGTVTFGSSPLASVVMNGLTGNPITNESGVYSGTEDAGWTGTVTPTLNGYTFSPVYRTYAAPATYDLTAQDYTAILTVAGDENWDDQFWAKGLNGNVRAIAVSGTNVYAGGLFTQAGGNPANYIAKWDTLTSTWSALGSGLNGIVYAIAASGTDVYVGGNFTQAGGNPANYIAKWDTLTNTWSALGSGLNSYVRALAVSGTDVYVGGNFTQAGETSANYIARWDETCWSTLGVGTSGRVYTIAVSGTDVYVGGLFVTAGGVEVSNIARWNGTNGWSGLGGGVTDGAVYAIAFIGPDAYIAGDFSNLGTGRAGFLAIWNDATGWSGPPAWSSNYIDALAVSGTDLYVGQWDILGGNTIKKLDTVAATWSMLGSGLGPEDEFPWVYAVAATGADVYVGGKFTTAGGKPSYYFGRWMIPSATKRVDFNKDGQEDLLWRYYGSGGRNRAWFLGATGSLSEQSAQLDLPIRETITMATGVIGLNERSVAERDAKMGLSRIRTLTVADPRDAVSGKKWQEIRTAVTEGLEAKGRADLEMDSQPAQPGVVDPLMAASFSAESSKSDKAEILASSGEVSIETSLLGGADILAVPDLNWQIMGTGDFNRDGNVDILWRYNSTGGRVRVWYMNGTNLISGAELTAVSDLNWRIAGTGDFNNDGNVDILWRYNGAGGRVRVWYMNGISIISGADLNAVTDLNWQVGGIGDFNKDGNVDILWRYYGTGGRNRVWYMNGVGGVISGADLLAVSDVNWQIGGVADYGGDGNVDIVWRYNGTGGYVYIWNLNGISWTKTEKMTAVPDLNWRIVSR